jgi:hypothetical protein
LKLAMALSECGRFHLRLQLLNLLSEGQVKTICELDYELARRQVGTAAALTAFNQDAKAVDEAAACNAMWTLMSKLGSMEQQPDNARVRSTAGGTHTPTPTRSPACQWTTGLGYCSLPSQRRRSWSTCSRFATASMGCSEVVLRVLLPLAATL